MHPDGESTPGGDRGDGEDELRDRIVSAIRRAPQPVVNTHYLVKRLDLPFEEVFDHLERLLDEGVLEHVEVEGRGHLWWLSPESELNEGRDSG